MEPLNITAAAPHPTNEDLEWEGGATEAVCTSVGIRVNRTVGFIVVNSGQAFNITDRCEVVTEQTCIKMTCKVQSHSINKVSHAK